jgi:hypothetical protein
MSSINFEQFFGLDKKSSPTDIDKKFFQEIKNLSTTKQPGKLVKDGAYSDVSDSLVGTLPADIDDIKSIAQLSLTRPSEQDVYLIHAQDGSNNHKLWVGPYWNGSSFTNEWLELTENVGSETCGAASTASQIDIASGESGFANYSTTDDYYNDWFVYISNISATARVTDYSNDGSNATWTVTTNGLTGITASTDTFVLFKYPVIRENDIAAVDDVVRWAVKENTAIGMTGNTSSFGTQYNLWYGYINRTFGTTNPHAFNDFWLDTQQMLAPPSGDEIQTQQFSGAGGMTDATWHIFFAYEYDGDQIGPLSETAVAQATSAPNDHLRITVSLPFDANYDSGGPYDLFAFTDTYRPTDYDPSPLSRRVTALRVYLRQSTSSASPTFAGRYVISSSDTSEIDFALGADGILEEVIEYGEDPTGNTYLQDVGQTNLRPNFKYGTALGSHFLAAAVRTQSGEQQNNDFIASIVDGAGVAATDTFGASNIANLGFYGSKSITGIHVLGDEGIDQSPKARAMVFTDDDYYVVQITSGASFAYQLDNIGEKEGLHAPDSLVYAEGNLYGVSRNGFRLFSPRGTKILGEGLKDDFDSLTTPSEGIGAYYKEERLIVWTFKTDTKSYALDLLSGQMIEYDFDATLSWFTAQKDGGLLSTDGSKIYEHGTGTDQDSNYIVPVVKTKRFTAQDMGGMRNDEIIFTELLLSYKSNTAITCNFYLDGSASALSWNDASLFAAQATEGEVRIPMPLGSRGKSAEVELTLSDTQKTTNTSFEVNNIRVNGYIKRRI